jgi:hypothetical protein
MKTTLEIPDELYRQAKVQAAHENRKMKDLVSEGLRLVLGLTKKSPPKPAQRMANAPVKVRAGKELPALVKEEMDETARREEESRRKALAVMEEIRRNPPYSPKRVQELIEENNRLRKEGWSRSDLGE